MKIFDSHFHIIDPKYPLFENNGYLPPKFTIENYLAEGCISNVFLIKDGKLLTPQLDTPILPGIIRAYQNNQSIDENYK